MNYLLGLVRGGMSYWDPRSGKPNRTASPGPVVTADSRSLLRSVLHLEGGNARSLASVSESTDLAMASLYSPKPEAHAALPLVDTAEPIMSSTSASSGTDDASPLSFPEITTDDTAAPLFPTSPPGDPELASLCHPRLEAHSALPSVDTTEPIVSSTSASSGTDDVSPLSSPDVATDDTATPLFPTSFPGDPELEEVYIQLNSMYVPHKEGYLKLSVASKKLEPILQDLCKCDPRFLFIKNALEEYLEGDLGLHKRGARLIKILESTHSQISERAAKGSISALAVKARFLVNDKEMLKSSEADDYDLDIALCEIIDAAIYELLDIFGIDIVPANIPNRNAIPEHLDMLSYLYSMSKNLSLPINEFGLGMPNAKGKETMGNFVYQDCLNAPTGFIRVLEIHPGTADAQIQCSLKLCNIYHDTIKQALSYVWGKGERDKEILVDGKELLVTSHLHKILVYLRRLDEKYTIWIDAICINQQDMEEKTHQVRYMKDIYSRSESTLIWLGGQSTDEHFATQTPETAFDPNNIDEPLPQKFGDVSVDQYNLSYLLKAFFFNRPVGHWDEKQIAIYFMIFRCVRAIILHEWWGRMWTLQEGALPPHPPTFIFHGQRISLNDVITAMKLINDTEVTPETMALLQKPDEVNAESEPMSVLRVYLDQGPHLTISRTPILLKMRAGSLQEKGRNFNTLVNYLHLTDNYRATDPRDKLFALQSLLVGSAGKLINVDYTESCEDVFKRVTSRCYNSSIIGLALAAKFDLLIETREGKKEHQNYPSWVLDFSYNDVYFKNGKMVDSPTDEVTLGGFLYENIQRSPKSLLLTKKPFFATQRTLFCAGTLIDRIYKCNVIPDFDSVDENRDIFISITSFIHDIYKEQNERRALYRPCESNLGEKEKEDRFSKEFSGLYMFFSLLYLGEIPKEGFENFINRRLHAIAGRFYFITDRGFVGIATLPVQQGDEVWILHGAPVYFILREATDFVDRPQGLKEHQIVARAAINEDEDDMEAIVSFVTDRQLRIV